MRYLGKFRGIVTHTNDPQKMGRIRVKCPSVLGSNISNWALPCLPTNYFALPEVGTLVWMEFEGGAKDRPIWTGVFYDPKRFKTKFGSDYYYTKDIQMISPRDIIVHAQDDVTIEANDNLIGKEKGSTIF